MPVPNEAALQEKTQRLRIVLSRLAADGGGLESLASELESLPGGAGEIAPAVAAIRTLNSLFPGEPLTPEQSRELEAVVLPRFRPTLLIANGSFTTPPAPWQHLGENPVRQRLEAACRSIGRVCVPNASPPHAGTAFVVGSGLMMTSRHVAERFALGVGQQGLMFRSGHSATIDLGSEPGPDRGAPLQVRKVVLIHPHWDMALLEVEGLDERHPALTLDSTAYDTLVERSTQVAVVGYPASDSSHPDQALHNQIFGDTSEVKRLQPGRLLGRRDFRGSQPPAWAGVHDASTAGRNSGAAVIDLETGHVVALHFAGDYLRANYAVPASELAQDSRVVRAGVSFLPGASPSDFYGQVWANLERRETPAHNASTADQTHRAQSTPARPAETGLSGAGRTGVTGGTGATRNTGVTGVTGNMGGSGTNWVVDVPHTGGAAAVTLQIPLQITISLGTPQVVISQGGETVPFPPQSAGPRRP